MEPERGCGIAKERQPTKEKITSETHMPNCKPRAIAKVLKKLNRWLKSYQF
jgi:hypothetical protein